MNQISSIIYRTFEWITRFAYLQLLWAVFTLAGGILFGLIPSTVAVYAIIRSWLRGNTDIPLFSSFWNYYKNDFLKSNKLGILIYLIFLLIGLDFIYLQEIDQSIVTWMHAPLFAFMLLSMLFVFYLFPAFVHFDLNNHSIVKHAFFIMLIHPFHSLLMVLSLASLFIIIYYFPAIGLIFGVSSIAYITMWLALHAFNKVQKKN
ncbi:YesL family protein [Robertmurraya massiliosenegalensis]|uniref:YesL family protein n=1 Tax=Robertmurraya massiliosenegalensis TaxID=1287657 RepID=UPI0003166977|nr:DUF624 domain-containing protein [Robertmurraya massiliosenegalensis]